MSKRAITFKRSALKFVVELSKKPCYNSSSDAHTMVLMLMQETLAYENVLHQRTSTIAANTLGAGTLINRKGREDELKHSPGLC
jgi:hypothetical protein